MSESDTLRVSQSEPERARMSQRDIGSGSQLIMHDNEREIGSQQTVNGHKLD